MKSSVIGLIVALLVCNAYADPGNSRMIRKPNTEFHKSAQHILDTISGVTRTEAMPQLAVHGDSSARDLQQSAECQVCNAAIWDVHSCPYGSSKDSKNLGTFKIAESTQCFKDSCCAKKSEDCCNASSNNETPYVFGYIVASILSVLVIAVLLCVCCCKCWC